MQRFDVGTKIVLQGLDRSRSYDVQARAVSKCGAKSAWGMQTVTVVDANQRVGQGNIDLLTTGGQRSAWVGLAVSYSATPTSATINYTAGTLRDGANNPTYAASSVTVSGTAGSKVTYWLYYDDPRGLGGNFPLGATSVYEDLIATGRAWVGNVTVTFPASGTGSGGGGTGGGGIGCPDENALVLVLDPTGDIVARRAGDIVPGDSLWGADEETLEPRVFAVSHSDRKLQPGVQVDTQSGGRIRCSTSAPLPTPDGLRTAPLVAGKSIGFRAAIAGDASWDTVGTIRTLGEIWVQHITADNGCFWVSCDDGTTWILHHNLKQVEP
ncbi:MAG: hypothetical protein ABIV36_06860 [Sphingobium limneticum]